eukprot:PhM_4_TR3643/c0_g1_i1/m.8062
MSNTTLTLEDIFRDIVARPGTAIGVPLGDLQRIWEGISVQCFRTVVQRKTLVIPNFCHFYFSTRTMDQHPCFFFSPTFCATYRVTALQPHLSRVTHNSSPCPNLTLNPSAVAVHCGVSRNAVSNALKDIIRRIGEVVLHGKGGAAVAITFTDLCKVVVRHGGRYDVHWNSKAIGHMSTTARGLELLHKREPANNNPDKASEVPPAAADDSDLIQVAAPDQVMRFARPTSAPAPRTRLTHQPQQHEQPPEDQHPDATTTTDDVDNNKEKNTLSHQITVPDATQNNNSRPTPPKQISPGPGLHVSTMMPYAKRVNVPQSKYLAHKAHKASVRRGRNEVYRDSWEEQLRRKREEKESDFARSVAAQEQYLTSLREEEAKDRKLQHDIRQQEKRVRDVNVSLATQRANLQIPRAHAMGSLFNGRACTHNAPSDIRFLTKQIREQEERRRAERDEERRVGEQIIQMDKHQLEKERRRRRELKQQLQEELRVAAEEAERKSRLRAPMQDWGGDLFFTNLSPSQRKTDEISERHKSQLDAQRLQRENVEMARMREMEARQQRQEQHENLKLTAREAVLREGAHRSIRHRAISAQQRELCGAWDSQLQEKSSRDHAVKEQQRRWRDASYWVNDSSDDEEN